MGAPGLGPRSRLERVKYVAAILPSAGVAFLFWLAIRAVFEADRRERAAEARERRAARDAGRDTGGHSSA